MQNDSALEDAQEAANKQQAALKKQEEDERLKAEKERQANLHARYGGGGNIAQKQSSTLLGG